MFRPARLGLAAAIVALLAGCASMTEEECLTADWYERGLSDGRNGQPYDYLAQHREACAKVDIVPQENAYRKGHTLGIRDYCTPENGARLGRHGGYYRNACPADLHGAFVARYQSAYRIHQAEQRVNSLTNDIQRKERELDKEKNEDKRRRIRRELHDLDDRLRRARNDLYQTERNDRRRY